MRHSPPRFKRTQGVNLLSSSITPESIYRNRRLFMQGTLAAAAVSGIHSGLGLSAPEVSAATIQNKPEWLKTRVAEYLPSSENTLQKELTPEIYATTYNNFYEFGTDKDDPVSNASGLTTDPWNIEVAGEVNKPGTVGLEDILRTQALQERIYRLRCVEAWSMVVPWIGFPLKDLLSRFEPNSHAKFVKFTTLLRPDEMPGQKSFFSSIPWPYREGLRLDEAQHPLTILAVGMYGKVLPNQNGAPLRLVVPWKYGFKSIKSIVKIELTRTQPKTSWNTIAAKEYGFYANVNPSVDHPRWSQATERRLPSSLFNPNRIDTLPFNGYAEEVAGMYAGMDLSRYY